MNIVRLLKHDELLQLHAAVLEAHLASNRDTLLTGLGPGLIAGIPAASNTKAQILTDLNALNDMGSLPDGSPPLIIWLKNAVVLGGDQPQTAVFEHFILILKQRLLHYRMQPLQGATPYLSDRREPMQGGACPPATQQAGTPQHPSANVWVQRSIIFLTGLMIIALGIGTLGSHWWTSLASSSSSGIQAAANQSASVPAPVSSVIELQIDSQPAGALVTLVAAIDEELCITPCRKKIKRLNSDGSVQAVYLRLALDGYQDKTIKLEAQPSASSLSTSILLIKPPRNP